MADPMIAVNAELQHALQAYLTARGLLAAAPANQLHLDEPQRAVNQAARRIADLVVQATTEQVAN